jgi:hypothetical protein
VIVFPITELFLSLSQPGTSSSANITTTPPPQFFEETSDNESEAELTLNRLTPELQLTPIKTQSSKLILTLNFIITNI